MTTYRTTRRLIVSLAGGITVTSLGLAAMSAHADRLPSAYPTSSSMLPMNVTALPRAENRLVDRLLAGDHHFWDALDLTPAEPTRVWDRLRDSFAWQDEIDRPRVRKWIEYYRKSPHNIVEIAERARPWLHWITDQLEARGLPGEIALLPFVESAFKTSARNRSGATGLWQLMPRTGKALGLRLDRGYDGRLDVVTSTRAALDYIEQQAEQWYRGDLALSLAAYNAGAGRVNRSLRAAARAGKPKDYWHLRLPRETMNYVPKLLAISAIVADPKRYAVNLPAIEDSPAFAQVPLNAPLSLAQAAALADVSRSELEMLNPGLLNNRADPRQIASLLVPVDSEAALLAGLDRLESGPGSVATLASNDGGRRYRVRRGDSLSLIAQRHGVTLASLRRHNSLAGDTIHAGQTLHIPQTPVLASSG
ncbi:transglycosylase SLT domain-containing protein [Pistricoccus aurantiacus]|uniref:transglycosylase SLT domain-containing protein n=1 Tax=Pistricoccus aurantiacus TaxID=1883414 RepID=UPI00362815A5